MVFEGDESQRAKSRSGFHTVFDSGRSSELLQGVSKPRRMLSERFSTGVERRGEERRGAVSDKRMFEAL